jgi:hypothetical protein
VGGRRERRPQLLATDEILGVERAEAPGVLPGVGDRRDEPATGDQLDGDSDHRSPRPDRRLDGLVTRQLDQLVEHVPEGHAAGSHDPALHPGGARQGQLQLGVGPLDVAVGGPQPEGHVPRQVRRQEGGFDERGGEHGGA